MSPSSREVEREVEASRARVEQTVEALKDKMSVGQMVAEATRYLGESGGAEFASNLGAQVRSNPLPLALVGVGLAWLMSGRGAPHLSRGHSAGRAADVGGRFESLDAGAYRRTFGGEADDSRREGGYTAAAGDAVRRGVHGVRDAAAGAAAGLGSVASGLSSAATGLASSASQLGRGAYSAAGSAAGAAQGGAAAAWRGGYGAYRGASRFGSDAYSGASRFGRGARRSLSDVLETEPLVLAAVGLAAGAAIGALLPRTAYEDRTLGDARDRMRDDVEAYAREQFERGKAVAEEAYRTARAEAEAQGLTTLGGDSVAGRIGEVARATLERAKEKAAEEGLTAQRGSGEPSPGQDGSA